MSVYSEKQLWAITLGRLCFCIYWGAAFAVALSVAPKRQRWMCGGSYMTTGLTEPATAESESGR